MNTCPCCLVGRYVRTKVIRVRNKDKPCSSTLKSAVFSSSSSLPPFVSEGGGLVC